ncbi:MAG: caspase family protein [Bacteroidia bacterium]|nr:caspase family protein [Bacteroidia bacterium]
MKRLIVVLPLAFAIINAFGQKLLKNLANSHAGEILSVSVTNDGSMVVTGGADKRSYIWDTKTGDKVKSFGSHADKVTSVSFSSDNKLFATGSADKKIIIWGVDDGKPRAILKDHTTPITAVAFNPVNETKASGSEGDNIRLWDAANKMAGMLDCQGKKVTAIEYSPDGKMLASTSDDNILRLWDVESQQLTKEISTSMKGLSCVTYSSDGKIIACGGADGSVAIWDAKSYNKLTDFSDLKGDVKSVDFTPDVQYLAAAGMDNRIVIWELEMAQMVKDIKAHTKGITAIRFSDKGNILISAGNEGTLCLWDVSALNIGKKKAATESKAPNLICSALHFEEKNENGILEYSDYPKLVFTITNKGEGTGYDVTALIEQDKPIEGLVVDKETFIGNLTPGKTHKVEIPITVALEIGTTFGSFKVSLNEANGNNPEPLDISFQTKGTNTAYILVGDYKYSSATGKAEIGSPVTLKLVLKNATNTEAKNIKIRYFLPDNVVAVDKLMESFDEFKPNEVKETSMQFYASDKFTGNEIKIGVDIEGAAYTNLKDVTLAVKMNEPLPVNTDVYIANLQSTDQPVYRGGGDPLKGLNVSEAKREMQFGNYYALIVGIDKYKGEWPALKNAVQDAKAVEQVLKSKYKFDYFRTLYDEQATRESIIKEMEWLVANVKSTDNVFIYYSGHGDFKQALNKGYWVPNDATVMQTTSQYISNSDIQTFLSGISSKHTLLISDACFSGDIFRGNTITVPFENSEKYYHKVNDLSSRQAISSGGIEPVMDGGKDGHSVFAYYLLKTLQNNSFKYFDASQLFDKIKVPIVNNSNQSPNFSPIKNTGDEGGQFIFILK